MNRRSFIGLMAGSIAGLFLPAPKQCESRKVKTIVIDSLSSDWKDARDAEVAFFDDGTGFVKWTDADEDKLRRDIEEIRAKIHEDLKVNPVEYANGNCAGSATTFSRRDFTHWYRDKFGVVRNSFTHEVEPWS